MKQKLKAQVLVLLFLFMSDCFCVFSHNILNEINSPPTTEHPLVSKKLWNTIFPYRFGAKDIGGGVWVLDPKDDFYTYESFLEALNKMSKLQVTFERRCGTNAYKITRTDKTTGTSKVIRTDADFTAPRNIDKEIVKELVDYGSFLNEGSEETRKRELMAFFANISHETTGGWDTAPGGKFSWGLHFREEPTNASYAYPDVNYPPTPGKSYKGRGPIQLSYNYNYGPASEFIFGDKQILLDNPEKVIQDAALAFQTAIWFWMTPQYPKPSAHNVMVRKWNPTDHDKTKNRVHGLGMTVNIINGGVECGQGKEKPQVLSRIGYYKRYSTIFNVGTDMDGVNDQSDCGCKDMAKYGADSKDLTSEPCAQKPGLTFVSPINNQVIEQKTFSSIAVKLEVDKKDTALKTLVTTVGNQTFNGESFSWTPDSYGAHTLAAKATFQNGLTVTNSIKVVVWDGINLDCSLVPEWKATRIYDKPHNYVRYKNAVYRNKWYATFGLHPDKNGVWEKVVSCGTNTGSAPVVSWKTPTQNQIFEVKTLQPIRLVATATDSDGSVQNFVFKHKNTVIQATQKGSEYSGTFTPTAFGQVNITAEATDNSNKTTSKKVAFTIKKVGQNTAPVISEVSPKDLSVIEQKVLSSIVLSAKVTDNTSVSSVVFNINGVAVTPVSSGTSNSYTARWSPNTFGDFNFEIIATDNEGAKTTSTTKFTVKKKSISNVPPVISAILPADGAVIEQSSFSLVRLSANVQDNVSVSSVEFFVNNTLITNSGTSGTYTGSWLPSTFGNVTFKVVAKDNEGATTTSNVSFTIKKKGNGGGSCGGVAPWTAKVYAKRGTQVSYKGAIYVNKWYASSSEVPGKAGVWNFVKFCSGGNTTFCGAPVWMSSKIYQSKQKVYFNQKIYQARWWTQGSAPDKSNEWRFVSDCRQTQNTSLAYKIFPNTVSDEVNFDIQSDKASTLRIDLLDFSGKSMRILVDEKTQKGTNTYTKNLSELDPGLYFYRITINGKVVTEKLIKN